MRWIALRPGYLQHWWDDNVDIDGWFVADLDHVTGLVQTCRTLLGAGDPAARATFDRLHAEGWHREPPHWSGEPLRAFTDAAGRLPDPTGAVSGFWELTDATVRDLAPRLTYSRRLTHLPVDDVRHSIRMEWLNARQLHVFLADALAAGNEVAAD